MRKQNLIFKISNHLPPTLSIQIFNTNTGNAMKLASGKYWNSKHVDMLDRLNIEVVDSWLEYQGSKAMMHIMEAL